MSRIRVESEQVVNARPEDVYAFLADYRNKRPQILPPNYLSYGVERGGRGSGTIIYYLLRAGGRQRAYRMEVEETSRGRMLEESDTVSSLVTTWTLNPVHGGQQTQVNLRTEWEGGKGIGGFFERVFAPMGLHRIYADMLDRLSNAVSSQDARRLAAS